MAPIKSEIRAYVSEDEMDSTDSPPMMQMDKDIYDHSGAACKVKDYGVISADLKCLYSCYERLPVPVSITECYSKVPVSISSCSPASPASSFLSASTPLPSTSAPLLSASLPSTSIPLPSSSSADPQKLIKCCSKKISKKRSSTRGCTGNAARERSRVQTLRSAYLCLQHALPSVPADTKLSKLDIILLATAYITSLRKILLHHEPSQSSMHVTSHPRKKWPMRTQLYDCLTGDATLTGDTLDN